MAAVLAVMGIPAGCKGLAERVVVHQVSVVTEVPGTTSSDAPRLRRASYATISKALPPSDLYDATPSKTSNADRAI